MCVNFLISVHVSTLTMSVTNVFSMISLMITSMVFFACLMSMLNFTMGVHVMRVGRLTMRMFNIFGMVGFMIFLMLLFQYFVSVLDLSMHMFFFFIVLMGIFTMRMGNFFA